MKKLLAIILALTMVLSLAACGGSTVPQEAADPKADAPAEEASEAPTAEGKRVALLMATIEGAYWQSFVDDYSKAMEECGMIVDPINADGDPVRQVEQIENAVVQGYDLLFVFPTDPNAVADACKKAMDAGVLVFSFIKDVGAENRNCFRGANEAVIGEGIVDIAAEWAIETFGDAEKSCNVIVVGGSSAGSETERYEAVCAKAAAIPQFNVLETIRMETSQAAAQAGTENLLVNHDNVNLIIYCSTEMGIGGVAYIESEASPIKDYSTMGIFGGGVSAEAADAMRRAAEGNGVWRGCINTGGTNAAMGKEVAAQMVLMFTTDDYPTETYVPAILVNVDNLADFGF